MPRRELLRYRQFLGIQKEQQNIKETEKEMKARYAKGQDFTSPDIGSAIQAAKTAETPIDGCASWPLTAYKVRLPYCFYNLATADSPVLAS